jgi:hypothetical protein
MNKPYPFPTLTRSSFAELEARNSFETNLKIIDDILVRDG